MTPLSRYITSASRYHLCYQNRSSMYIHGLLPRNSAELTEPVPIDGHHCSRLEIFQIVSLPEANVGLNHYLLGVITAKLRLGIITYWYSRELPESQSWNYQIYSVNVSWIILKKYRLHLDIHYYQMQPDLIWQHRKTQWCDVAHLDQSHNDLWGFWLHLKGNCVVSPQLFIIAFIWYLFKITHVTAHFNIILNNFLLSIDSCWNR